MKSKSWKFHGTCGLSTVICSKDIVRRKIPCKYSIWTCPTLYTIGTGNPLVTSKTIALIKVVGLTINFSLTNNCWMIWIRRIKVPGLTIWSVEPVRYKCTRPVCPCPISVRKSYPVVRGHTFVFINVVGTT